MQEAPKLKPGICSKIIDRIRKIAIRAGLKCRKHELEFVRSLVSSTYKIPKKQISVKREVEGYKVLVFMDQLQEDLKMDVKIE